MKHQKVSLFPKKNENFQKNYSVATTDRKIRRVFKTGTHRTQFSFVFQFSVSLLSCV